MMICKNCGAKVPVGNRFCGQCGARVEDDGRRKQSQGSTMSGASASGQKKPNGAGYASVRQTPVKKKSSSWKKLFSLDSRDRTAQFDADDIRQNRLYAILASFGILFLIPLVAAPDSKYGRFCANQGLLFLIFGFLISVAAVVIQLILGLLTGIQVIGFLFSVLSALVGLITGLIVFGLFLFGLIAACRSQARELPLIGRFTIIR